MIKFKFIRPAHHQSPLPCCGYQPKYDSPDKRGPGEPLPNNHPVYYNPYNAVVQCHACGATWIPKVYQDGTARYAVSLGRSPRKTNLPYE